MIAQFFTFAKYKQFKYLLVFLISGIPPLKKATAMRQPSVKKYKLFCFFGNHDLYREFL